MKLQTYCKKDKEKSVRKPQLSIERMKNGYCHQWYRHLKIEDIHKYLTIKQNGQLFRKTIPKLMH